MRDQPGKMSEHQWILDLDTGMQDPVETALLQLRGPRMLVHE